MTIHALVGPYRVGKSTIATELAFDSGLPKIDTDALVRELTGINPGSLTGDNAIRDVAMLHEEHLPDQFEQLPPDAIVSTGYLLPMFPRTIEALLAQDVAVIYLKPDAAALDKRWNNNPEEPPIPKTIIEAILKEHHPVYQAIANEVVPIGQFDEIPDVLAATWHALEAFDAPITI
jgi:shikimate kinase